jgi:rubrerythrin
MTPTPSGLRKESLQTEIDAAFLYDRIAANENDPRIAQLFREMAAIERGHAAHAFTDLHRSGILSTMPGPSWRARTLDRIGRAMGYDHVIAQLMDVEKGLAQASVAQKQRSGASISGSEQNHVRILRSLMEGKRGMAGEQLGRI